VIGVGADPPPPTTAHPEATIRMTPAVRGSADVLDRRFISGS
jgi:hypothetical protein